MAAICRLLRGCVCACVPMVCSVVVVAVVVCSVACLARRFRARVGLSFALPEVDAMVDPVDALADAEPLVPLARHARCRLRALHHNPGTAQRLSDPPGVLAIAAHVPARLTELLQALVDPLQRLRHPLDRPQ